MHIWVDADACPLAVKEILYRAAERAQVQMTLVANKLLGTPRSPWIRALQVARGFDVADHADRKRFADQLDRFLAKVKPGPPIRALGDDGKKDLAS